LDINPSYTINNFNQKHLFSIYNNTSPTMKVTALLYTLMAAAAVSAAAVPESDFEILDTCGSGYGGDQRRTNSPCKSSNGDRHFCGCDRTGVVC
jgi:hypothetical protein